jgi:hypothetical protein
MLEEYFKVQKKETVDKKKALDLYIFLLPNVSKY